MNAEQQLRKALGLITKYGWIQNDWGGKQVGFCELGALQHVYVLAGESADKTLRERLAKTLAGRCLAAATAERAEQMGLPDWAPESFKLNLMAIPNFNDHRKVTAKDIRKVFRRAIQFAHNRKIPKSLQA